MPAQQPYVIVADDHPLFRAALRQSVSAALSPRRLEEAADIASLQQLLDAESPDLVLLDLSMPGARGFSALVFLVSHFASVPVIVISGHEAPEIAARALQHGASAFLPKSSPPETIAEVLALVLDGGSWVPPGTPSSDEILNEEHLVAEAIASLTPQQFRVAMMLHQGLLNKQIAWELQVTEATVKAHLTEIFRKLKVNSRTQAVLALTRLDVAAADTGFSD